MKLFKLPKNGIKNNYEIYQKLGDYMGFNITKKDFDNNKPKKIWYCKTCNTPVESSFSNIRTKKIFCHVCKIRNAFISELQKTLMIKKPNIFNCSDWHSGIYDNITIFAISAFHKIAYVEKHIDKLNGYKQVIVHNDNIDTIVNSL